MHSDSWLFIVEILIALHTALSPTLTWKIWVYKPHLARSMLLKAKGGGNYESHCHNNARMCCSLCSWLHKVFLYFHLKALCFWWSHARRKLRPIGFWCFLLCVLHLAVSVSHCGVCLCIHCAVHYLCPVIFTPWRWAAYVLYYVLVSSGQFLKMSSDVSFMCKMWLPDRDITSHCFIQGWFFQSDTCSVIVVNHYKE